MFKSLENIETAVARDSRLFARCMSTASIYDVAVLEVHVENVLDII